MATGQPGFIFCSGCGCQNPERNLFCSRCGTRILRAPAEGVAGLECPNCRHKNDEGAAFCIRCSAPLPKDVVIKETEDVLTLSIMKDQVDFENHREFVAILNKIIKKRIIIDLSNVKWMDSTGIGMLVTYAYKTTRTKQEVKIVGVGAKIKEAIRALRVDNVLDIYEDSPAALASWGLVG